MDKKSARERIDKLKKEIDRYRYAYHVLDKSLVSDAVNDSLKKELQDLEQKYPGLVTADSPTQRVGGEPLKEFKKVQPKQQNAKSNAKGKIQKHTWLAKPQVNCKAADKRTLNITSYQPILTGYFIKREK